MKKLLAVALASLLAGVHGAAVGLWAAEAAALTGLVVEPDTVRLKLDRPAKYNTFTIANPPRLVLELLNSEHRMAVREAEGKGKYLKKVRAGQFEKEPYKIVRVVLDLSESGVGYKVEQAKGEFLVMLKGSASGSQQPAAPAPIVPAQAKPKDAVADTKPAQAAPAPPPQVVVAAVPAAAVVAAPALQAPASLFKASLKSSKGPDIMASLPNDPVTLDFDGTDVKDVLRLIGAKARVNVIYGPDVQGTVTLHLANVPFKDAVDTIFRMQNLVTVQVGHNILRVMTPPSLEKERSSAVLFTKVFSLKYGKALELKPHLDNVRTTEGRKGNTVADIKSNSVIVTDTPEGLVSTEHLIRQLDVQPMQVMIEAKIIEVTLGKDLNLGVQWDLYTDETSRLGGKFGFDSVGSVAGRVVDPASTFGGMFALPSPHSVGLDSKLFPLGATGRGTGVFLPANQVFGALTFGRVTNSFILNTTLSAAATQGKIKVLSDPKIATLNNQPAEIKITSQIPYTTASVTPTGVVSTAVTYVQTGITLVVTPTINSDRRITLQVAPNVSQAAAASLLAGGAPAIDSRTAQTTVLVKDGETIVIGGLVRDSESKQTGKVPLLGDIPVLGWILFRKTSNVRSRQELMVFVTTHILPD